MDPGKEATMSDRCQVRLTGPLALYTDGFREDLIAEGYVVQTIDRKLRILAHLSSWMVDKGLSVHELTPERVEAFIEVRRREGYRGWLSEPAVRPLISYLTRLGVVAVTPEMAEPTSAVDRVVEEYRRYLSAERGLTPDVVRKYARAAREFLGAREQTGGLDLAGLSAGSVTDYVVAECRGRSSGSAKLLVTALRSLLGYLFLAGHTDHQLGLAVPKVAHWGAGSLPRGLSPEVVAALLASCAPGTVIGRRDRAILVLLARLGLRACEAARLELGDLDWRAGEIGIRGKGGRYERLPLPVDVGEAMVAYLYGGRPRVACRAVFLRMSAPIVGLTVPAVTAVVYRACRRAGVPRAGAHRLRHSAATAMLAGGGSLVEIGQVLRHARAETTAIYAKVDRIALGGLAQPWPGVPA
jgi:site-specific recombinase XerD